MSSVSKTLTTKTSRTWRTSRQSLTSRPSARRAGLVVLSGWVDLSGVASLAGGVASPPGGVASLLGGVAAGRERSMPEGCGHRACLGALDHLPSQLHMHSSDMAWSRLRAAAGLSFAAGAACAESEL